MTIDEFTRILKRSAGTATEVSDTMEEGLGNRMKQLESAFTSLQLEIASVFAPVLIDIMNIIKQDFLPLFTNGLMPIISRLIGLLPGLATAVAPFIEKIIELVSESDIAGRMIDILVKVFDALSPVLDIIVRVIGTMIDIWEALIPIMDAMVSVIDLVMINWDQLATVFDIIPSLIEALSPLFVTMIRIFVTLSKILFEDNFLFKSLISVIESMMPVIGAFAEVMNALLLIIEPFIPIIEILSPLFYVLTLPLIILARAIAYLLVPPLLLLASVLLALVPIFTKLGKGITQSLGPIKRLFNWIKKIADILSGSFSNDMADFADIVNLDRSKGKAESSSGVLTFGEGGTVPGPSGAPIGIIAHGGETIYPEGEEPGSKTIIMESHDTFNNTFVINKKMDINEVERELTQVLINAKRQAKKQLLAEGV